MTVPLLVLMATPPPMAASFARTSLPDRFAASLDQIKTPPPSPDGATLLNTALAQTVSVAQANLTEMQRAVDGATARQSEFVQTRGLVPASGGTSAIDPELADLSARIATMRAIADDLETELGA